VAVSSSLSVKSSSAEEVFCSTGVIGAAEVGGAEDAAGSKTTTVESVGGADVTRVEFGGVGRTADGRIDSGCVGDSKVSD
jgi:hypothetical protein